MRTLLRYGSAYVIWLLALQLGLWFMLISRTGFLDLLAAYWADSRSTVYNTRFYDQAFTVGIGLLWLIFMILTEAYFREGAKGADLPRRVGRVLGPELLLIFLVDLILIWVQQGNHAGWFRWVIMGSELILGVLLVTLGWRGSFKKWRTNEGLGKPTCVREK